MSSLEVFKHLIFSWGNHSYLDINSIYRLNICNFTWAQHAMFIEFVVDDAYIPKYRPAEWLSFDRYLELYPSR